HQWHQQQGQGEGPGERHTTRPRSRSDAKAPSTRMPRAMAQNSAVISVSWDTSVKCRRIVFVIAASPPESSDGWYVPSVSADNCFSTPLSRAVAMVNPWYWNVVPASVPTPTVWTRTPAAEATLATARGSTP